MTDTGPVCLVAHKVLDGIGCTILSTFYIYTHTYTKPIHIHEIHAYISLSPKSQKHH